MQKRQLAELFDTDLARFKAINSALVAAERMWRQAVAEFRRARRREPAESSLNAHRRTPPEDVLTGNVSTPTPVAALAASEPCEPKASRSQSTVHGSNSLARIATPEYIRQSAEKCDSRPAYDQR